MGNPWKQYAKWKKLVTENYIPYDFIHMKVQNREIYRHRNVGSDCLGLGERGQSNGN